MKDEDITFDQVRDLSPLPIAASCRICGCTDEHACVDDQVGPCWWVEPDLCSHCAEPAIVAAEYDHVLATLSPMESAFQQRMNLWAAKARVALGRAATVDPRAFEL